MKTLSNNGIIITMLIGVFVMFISPMFILKLKNNDKSDIDDFKILVEQNLISIPTWYDDKIKVEKINIPGGNSVLWYEGYFETRSSGGNILPGMVFATCSNEIFNNLNVYSYKQILEGDINLILMKHEFIKNEANIQGLDFFYKDENIYFNSTQLNKYPKNLIQPHTIIENDLKNIYLYINEDLEYKNILIYMDSNNNYYKFYESNNYREYIGKYELQDFKWLILYKENDIFIKFLISGDVFYIWNDESKVVYKSKITLNN